MQELHHSPSNLLFTILSMLVGPLLISRLLPYLERLHLFTRAGIFQTTMATSDPRRWRNRLRDATPKWLRRRIIPFEFELERLAVEFCPEA